MLNQASNGAAEIKHGWDAFGKIDGFPHDVSRDLMKKQAEPAGHAQRQGGPLEEEKTVSAAV
ncbi:hypothetical protein JHU04_004073 [Brenneria sp. 4F2]|nr:hypothetical protein [Brenneria bubanii]